MKRSEINAAIETMKACLAEHRFQLPQWAYWNPSEWQGKDALCEEIIENALGWDVTDFGGGDFSTKGLTVFTIRNGNVKRGDKKSYAEKVMVVGENQETPYHFHWSKMEDIIVRGGGNLVVELRGSVSDDEMSDGPVTVSVDGMKRTVEAGGKVVLHPGESICLEQGVFHRFYGEPGHGLVLVGEVSTVNDDATDNNFIGGAPRYPEIEEDEAPVHLLCTEYRAHCAA